MKSFTFKTLLVLAVFIASITVFKIVAYASCWGYGGSCNAACLYNATVTHSETDGYVTSSCGTLNVNCVSGTACSADGSGSCYYAGSSSTYKACTAWMGPGMCQVCSGSNTCYAPIACTWYVTDSTAPTLSASNNSSTWYNASRSATVSATDAGGLAEVRYNWGSSSSMNAGCTTGGTVTSNGASLTSAAGGTTLFLCARDTAGNVAAWNGIYRWENTAPSLSVSNASSTWSKTAISGTVSVSDAGGSVLLETRYNWGSNAMNAGCSSGGTTTTNGSSLSASSGGTTLYVCARDNAGNVTTWNGVYNWENTNPALSASNNSSSWFNTSRSAVVAVSDSGGSVLVETRYNWGSASAMNAGCTSGGTTTTNGSSLNAPASGTTLYLCARDTAGNVATWNGLYRWENTAPSLLATNNSGSSTWYNSQRTATVAVSDSGGSALVETRYNWGSNTMNVGCTSGGTTTTSGSSLNAPAGGTTLYLCARDTAGNVSTWNGIYNWENTNPTLSATNASSSWSNSQIAAVISTADSGGSILLETRYNWGSNPMNVSCSSGGTTITNGSSLNAPSGGTTLYLCARDNAGNTVTWSGIYNWESTIPSTPGKLTATWLSDHYINTSVTVSTTGSTDTGGSGLSYYSLCRSADNATGCSVIVATGIGSTTTISGTNLPSNGSYRYYYWYATDVAGNNSLVSSGEYIRMDSSAPVSSNVSNAVTEGAGLILTANATDAGGSSITYQWFTGSSCASAITSETASTYSPAVQNEPAVITYSYKAYDIFNATSNCATATATWSNSAPSVTNVTGSANEGSQLILNALASDIGGTTLSYQWYNDATCNAALTDKTEGTLTLNAEDEPEIVNYSYKAFDAQLLASSCATATATWNNIAPTLNSIIKPANNIWTSDPEFCAQVSDTGGGIVTAKFVIGASIYTGNAVNSGENSCYTHFDDLNTVEWYAYAVDSSSISSENSTTRQAKIDSTLPAVSANNKSSQWFSELTATISGSDINGSGVASIRYAWDTNNLGVNCAAGNLTSNGAVLTVANGSHRLYLCAVDNAGNVNTWDSGADQYRVTTNVQSDTNIFKINNNDLVTASGAVTLAIAMSGQTQMMISNDASFTGANWEVYAITKSWTLGNSSVNEDKSVFIKFKDGNNQVSPTYIDGIELVASRLISDIPENVEAVLANNLEVNLSETGQTGEHDVYLKKDASFVAKMTVGFNNNLDWSGIQVDSNVNRAVFHANSGLTNLPGIVGNTFTLLVPKYNGTSVQICTGAETLSEITLGCNPGYVLHQGDASLSIVNIAGVDYWQITGLSGTGGISIRDYYGLNDEVSRQSIATNSNHTITFGTVNGVLASGDSITLTFDPANIKFNLSNIDYSDIDLFDDVGQKSLASSAGISTWGVTVNNALGTIVFTSPTSGSGYIQALSNVTIKIGDHTLHQSVGDHQIENPDTVNAYHINILIHNSINDEYGDVAIPIVDSDQVNIMGYVNTFINFDIDTAVSDLDCAFDACNSHGGGVLAGNYTVDLGELNSTWVNQSTTNQVRHADGNMGLINSIYLDLSSNAINGVVVYVKSDNGLLQGPGTSNIPAVIDGSNITINSGLYGFALPTAATVSKGVIILNSNCDQANEYCGPDTSFKTFATTNNLPVDSARLKMDIAAAATYIDNPGTYSDTLTFVVVPTY